ncbi:inactive protein RESTRICTED TEV MOVEMENT 2-like [Cornus florida]|uniref:inactive protein RESTRICTED TEV MOVEMENT 2-like n=1 Tax=Cornus florida TaxID=4283 RepID=UPI00289C9466|nr:inactive protein RESTRICTED TEV MOVEMENT 2-like [Cornus florida]
MAMRTSRTSGTAPSRPPRAMGRPVYEDFKPVSELKEEEEGGADVLYLYLPGFMREQVKVSTEGQNTLRVRGERLVGANTWSRFQEDFPIPENCNTREIRASFEGGTLAITMPRKIIPQVSPKVEAKTTREALIPQEATSKQRDAKNVQPSSPPKPANQPMPQKVQYGGTPPKDSPVKTQKGPQEDVPAKSDLNADNAKQRDAKIVQPSSPPKPASQPMPQKAQYDGAPPKGSPVKPQKGPQEDIQTKSDPNAENAKQRDTKIVRPPSPQKAAGEPMPRKVQEDNIPPKGTPTIGGNKQTDGRSTGTQKQTEEKSTQLMETKPRKLTRKIVEKVKESGDKRKESVEAKKRRGESDRIVGTQEVIAGGSGNKLESYIQAVKGLVRGTSEERQLMVNMGVAALVIVALGASIAYNFGSSGKSKD